MLVDTRKRLFIKRFAVELGKRALGTRERVERQKGVSERLPLKLTRPAIGGDPRPVLLYNLFGAGQGLSRSRTAG